MNKHLAIGLFFFLLLSVTIFAQPCELSCYKEAYDRFEANKDFSQANCHGGPSHFSQSYFLRSYMVMYRATKNDNCQECGIHYLDRMIDHIRRTIDQRDDNQGRVDYQGGSPRKIWQVEDEGKMYCLWDGSCNGQGGYGFLVSDGLLIYPIADFV